MIVDTAQSKTMDTFPFILTYLKYKGLPWWLSHKESACNSGDAGDLGSIAGLGRSPGGEHGNPHQYFCLENPMDGGAWQATAHRLHSIAFRSEDTEAPEHTCIGYNVLGAMSI